MIIFYTLSYSGRREDSHKLLETAISEYTGDTERAGALVSGMKKGENGKPYIDGFMHFSISHSGKAWAVLFDEAECGLDIQYEKNCDVLSIADRWYNPIDADIVKTAMKRDAAEANGDRKKGTVKSPGTEEFFRIWTRREALVKALGETVFDPSLPPVSTGIVPAAVVDADDPAAGNDHCRIQDISIPGAEGLHAAVCFNDRQHDSGYDMQICALNANK